VTAEALVIREMGHTNHTIVCFCRDVTVGDVEKAVRAGYADLETVKRFTGAFTGPCQGKTCLENIRQLVADLTGRPTGEVSLPAGRPPVSPVRLGTLAAEDEP
jgi:NAD(P)H-nitrite reductase large subunit